LLAVTIAATPFVFAGPARGAVSNGGSPSSLPSVSSRQQHAVQVYADAMTRATLAEICANRRRFQSKLRISLSARQLPGLKDAQAHDGSILVSNDRRQAQRVARAQELVYNAMVASESACRQTRSSCAAAARAVSTATSALQFALIEEIATTDFDCR
jgi:hypothetical protein